MNKEKQSTSCPTLKSDKGIAGLSILLTVIAMIFVIGFLVMVFAVIGGQLASQVTTPTTVAFSNTTSTTVVNSSAGTYVNGYNPSTYRACALTVGLVTNASDGVVIASGNYTVNGCLLTAVPGVTVTFNNTLWNVTGSINYQANNTATGVISGTTTSISGVSAWFPIIITITVMVALILLTVIIIVAIRSSGILAGGN